MNRKGNRTPLSRQQSPRSTPPPASSAIPVTVPAITNAPIATSQPIPAFSYPRGDATPPSEGRISVLGFMDSLYAGCIAFAVALAAQHSGDYATLKGFEAFKAYLPLTVALLWIIDDWICARVLLQHYGYPQHCIRATTRLSIDIVIAVISFFLILFSVPFHPVRYIGMFAAVSWLSLFWAWLLKKEFGPVDRDIQIIIVTHRDPAVLLLSFTPLAWIVTKQAPSSEIWDPIKIIYWIAVAMPMIIFSTYKVVLFYHHWRSKHAKPV